MSSHVTIPVGILTASVLVEAGYQLPIRPEDRYLPQAFFNRGKSPIRTHALTGTQEW